MSDVEPARKVGQPDERTAALHRLVRLDPPAYRRADVGRLAGIEHERSVKWWRAMGFPEVPDDVEAFTEADIEMVRRLAALSGAGVVDDEGILRLTRLLGASFSRIAEAQVAVVEELATTLPGAEPGTTNRDRSEALLGALSESVLDLLQDSLIYVWRRHLLAALGRRLQADETAAKCAVGFADLSGFTKLSQRVSVDRLAALVDEFENTAFDAVSARGGRAIKLIGDEVMFVANSLPVAVDIGLDIAERLGAIRDMPRMHCGIAYGPMVSVGGDVFGPTANLAARLTTIARPGTLVIPRVDAAQLRGRDDIEIVGLRRTFALKGIGDTRVVAVRRAAAVTPGSAQP
ncbi:MAG TPA: adenylate cyclase regulatory domain-containing protein [Acidimicrobiia bacterium]|nr:adenylate cyclase regulatory domain-containing protein [Acidimicrobiia bacterium]